MDSKTEQTKWFQLLEKSSVFIPIWPITSQQLPQWIMQRAKQLGLNITKDAADLLSNHVEGHLLAAAQEIEKLSLLGITHTIDRELIATTVTDNARFTIFDLVDQMINGHHERALRILKNLAEEDTEPTLVVWAITRELRMLADIANKQKLGATLSSLFNQHRVFEKRQPAIRAFLKKHSHTDCLALLMATANIDRMIKGAAPGNVWDEIERVVIKTRTPV